MEEGEWKGRMCHQKLLFMTFLLIFYFSLLWYLANWLFVNSLLFVLFMLLQFKEKVKKNKGTAFRHYINWISLSLSLKKCLENVSYFCKEILKAGHFILKICVHSQNLFTIPIQNCSSQFSNWVILTDLSAFF